MNRNKKIPRRALIARVESMEGRLAPSGYVLPHYIPPAGGHTGFTQISTAGPQFTLSSLNGKGH